MKLKLALFLLSTLTAISSFSQENKRNQKDVVHDKRIYFYLEEEGKEIKYFIRDIGNDGAVKIANNDVFSLKKSSECNIFFKWLNPLNYRIAFKDTVYVSPSDIAISDYIKSYLSALNTTSPTSNASTKSLGDALTTFAAPSATAVLGSDLITEKKAFESKDLNLLLIQLLNSKFEASDATSINDLIDNLHTLEDYHSYNFAGFISGDFDDLKNIRDYTKVLPTTDAITKKATTNYESTISKNEDAQKQLDPLKFTVSNKPIEAFTKVVVKDFIREVKNKVTADKELIQRLKDINTVLVKSVSSEESKDYKGYFQIKSIDFEDNQNFETSFIVSKYEIDSKKYEVIKKSDIVTRKIIFEKYDPVKVSISTGIFYANYNLKGFGVAQGANKLIVTEDDIKSNTAIPATFLNFLFDIGSRTFLPILQLGADPTKKRPFILLGGGFGIPSSRFAITGGPIWTWDAKLDKLAVGQEVTSTSDLENDIKYTFDMSPKGWYLGLQYNF
jgi:hypothetical protein